MPDSAIAAGTELAADSHGVISRSQAAAHLSNKRIATALRAGWLDQPYPGVLSLVGSVDTFRQRLRAATLAVPDHAAASHRSAARLHGLDGFEAEELIEVSVDSAHRWRFGGEVVSHHVAELAPGDVTEIDGIRVTTLARTMCDLGSVCGSDRVARALTSARRSGCSLRWLRVTVDRLHRPGQSGTGRLIRLLDAIPHEGRVPESWFEELLADCLEDPRIPELTAQHVVVDSDGQFVARVDLAVPGVKLAIEAHSKRHHFGPQAEAADADRDLRLAACGWEVVYLGWHAMKSPAEVVDLVASVIAARTKQAPPA